MKSILPTRHRLLLAPLALCLLSAVPSLVAAQPRCDAPRVLLSVDKSSSMLGLLPSGGTKWDAARDAIGSVTASFEDRIDFGLQVFPFPNRCEPGRVTIDIAPNDSMTIVEGLGTPPPSGGNYTPMAQTLDVLLSYAPLNDPTRDNHVILITDGWQWCDPYDASTRFTPVDAVDRLRRAGMTVHVVGFGAAVDSLTLNRAAVAAGTALPGCDPTLSDPAAMNHCYAQVDDLTMLRSALDSIARDITDEVCDGFDNDCDGTVDEGFDEDVDGYTICGTVPGMPGTTDPGLSDCVDTDAAIHPGATEICDGVDNDCDGAVDPGCSCMDGETRPCGMDVGACVPGIQRCVAGAWGTSCEGEVAAADEDLCDGADEDCDGEVDEDADCGPGAVCTDGVCEDLPEPDPGPAPEPEPEPMGDPTPVPQEGGCGCATVGMSTPVAMPLALLLGLIGFVVARVRRP